MSVLSDIYLSACSENLQSKLTYRLQHSETWLVAVLFRLLHKALVDERGYPIQDPSCCGIGVKSGTNRLYCLKRAASDKDGESPEKSLLLGMQQIITPRNGVAQ
jgi:hypothetical protein